jgi:hypothetical protein
MAGAGFELVAESTGNCGVSTNRGAESGAIDASKPANDPRLALVIERWTDLPEAIKSGILAMIDCCD